MSDQPSPTQRLQGGPAARPGQPPLHPEPEPATPEGRGGSALLLAVVAVIGVCLSCSIIGLAGLAGYNDGVQALERYARSTRQADIATQYSLALTDVAAGNNELAAMRLQHVVLTLGAPGGSPAALLTEVLAVTSTPTASPTLTPSPTLESTPTPSPSPTGGVQLSADALFAEAQAALTVRDYPTVINRLDILRGLDPQYRQAEVNTMLHQALTSLSRQYLTGPDTNRLAEGILLAEQARAIAPIGDLGYEAYVAGRYLDGLNAEGMECLLAVREWESVYAEAPQYRDVLQRLANSYAACGDAYTYQTEFCPAEQYYRRSLSLVNNSSVAARLADAREKCANATPTPTPTIEGVPPEGVPTEGVPPSG